MTDDPHAIAALATAAAHNGTGISGLWIPILGALIPILAIVMGVGIGMLALWLDYRKKREIYQLHHAERMAAIEKGIEVPPLPPEFFQSGRRFPATPAQRLYRGLLCLFLGVAFIASGFLSGSHAGSWPNGGQTSTGLLLIAAGAAMLLFYWLDRRRNVAATTDTAAPQAKTLSNDQSSTPL